MAQKSKFFRVAVSGPTIDGRTIDPAWLHQMAEQYNPQTYAARGNMEHIRGITGDKPFTALADVVALKAEDTDIVIDGKTEKRVGLFAQIEPTPDLIELNKRGQKLYTSIEVMTDFAGTKKAYLAGLAFTDSPASLGTERLQFTAHAKAYGNLISQPVEIDLQFEDAPTPTETQKAATDAFTAMKEFFGGFAKPAAPAVAAQPAVPAQPAQPAADAFAAQFTQLMTGMQTLSAAVEASARASSEAIGKVQADLDAFKTKVETTPAANYTARPAASGGGNSAHKAAF